MRRILVSFVALAALAVTGSAMATYTPHLVVTQSGPQTKIHLTIPKTDDATSRLVIYAPASAAPTLGQAPGTQIGTVTAQVNAKAISPDAILPLTGTVVVGDPADPLLVAAANACTGTATHAAIWNLVLTAAGQTLTVPSFVDATTGAEAAFGPGKLTTCLPSPDIPESAGGARFGSKLLDVDFTVTGVFTQSTTPITAWPSIFTPYTAGTATPNPAGTVTAIGIAAVPTVSFTARLTAVGRVVFSGKVSAGGIPAPSKSIGIFDGARRIAATKTTATGTYTFTGKVKKGVHSLRAKLIATDTDVTAQGCSLVPAGGPACVSATAAGATVFSKSVRLRIK